MAVKIRLKRFGRKKRPFYRLVIADQAAARDGKVVEEIGTYNPLLEPRLFEYKKDRLDYWLGQGAQPTESVERLLGEDGVLPKKEGQKARFPKKTRKEIEEIQQKTKETNGAFGTDGKEPEAEATTEEVSATEAEKPAEATA
ncbi:30S ribosomal protein S16 [bacterium]|jgi:small subunit ribosomal protein S16|nr:30S ribosomal protein S16 [bacterium]